MAVGILVGSMVITPSMRPKFLMSVMNIIDYYNYKLPTSYCPGLSFFIIHTYYKSMQIPTLHKQYPLPKVIICGFNCGMKVLSRSLIDIDILFLILSLFSQSQKRLEIFILRLEKQHKNLSSFVILFAPLFDWSDLPLL